MENNLETKTENVSSSKKKVIITAIVAVLLLLGVAFIVLQNNTDLQGRLFDRCNNVGDCDGSEAGSSGGSRGITPVNKINQGTPRD